MSATFRLFVWQSWESPYHIVTDEVRVTFSQFLAFTSLSGTSQSQMKAYLWIRKQFLRQEGGFPEAEWPDWTLVSTRCLPVTSQKHENMGQMPRRREARVLLAGALACILSLKRRTHIFMDSVIKAVGRKTNIFSHRSGNFLCLSKKRSNQGLMEKIQAILFTWLHLNVSFTASRKACCRSYLWWYNNDRKSDLVKSSYMVEQWLCVWIEFVFVHAQLSFSIHCVSVISVTQRYASDCRLLSFTKEGPFTDHRRVGVS